MMTSLICHFSQISIFSDISLEIFKQLHGGYTVKLLLTNCLFHTENTWTFVFCIDLLHLVHIPKLLFENFAIWTSQLVKKSIKFVI